ncbi:MobA-like NTP transferase domain-containing protein [Coniochaeta sp. 2T2.1]|nr:MobA-like NTP transferase domain-containing protein [Coniochaeta sp. 2T2.1]
MAAELKPLILAGSRSTRMGSPKHLLKCPDGTPLYQRQIRLLRNACPTATTIYISLAKDSEKDPDLRGAGRHKLQIIYDLDANETDQSLGPAQGLLTAHQHDLTATWLVLAVDYPLVSTDMLGQLQDAYQSPVTCFRNADGYCEPLIGIWPPEALRRLGQNIRHVTGPGPRPSLNI